jgi:excisionase family DNA binding protein
MAVDKPQDQLLTPVEAAARLKISRLTVGDWLRSGKLKGVKVGRLWRVRESDLEAFLKRDEK